MRSSLLLAGTLALGSSFGLVSCSAMGPRAYVQEQKLLLTYHRVTADKYDASGDLNATSFAGNDEPDVDGWDLQLDVDLDFGDVVVGYADRDYGFDASASEYFGGLKWWFGGTNKNSYFIAVARYANELEFPTTNGDAYWGYGAGIGITAQMTDNIFLDFKVLYEGLFSDIDIGPNDIDLNGFVALLGVGLLF